MLKVFFEKKINILVKKNWWKLNLNFGEVVLYDFVLRCNGVIVIVCDEFIK